MAVELPEGDEDKDGEGGGVGAAVEGADVGDAGGDAVDCGDVTKMGDVPLETAVEAAEAKEDLDDVPVEAAVEAAGVEKDEAEEEDGTKDGEVGELEAAEEDDEAGALVAAEIEVEAAVEEGREDDREDEWRKLLTAEADVDEDETEEAAELS